MVLGPTFSRRRLSELSLNVINEEDPETFAKCDFESTKSSIDTLPLTQKEGRPTQQGKASTKTVRFDEASTVYHASSVILDQDDCRLLWCNDEEIAKFRNESREVHRTIYAFDRAIRSPTSWCSQLRRVYFQMSDDRNTVLGLSYREMCLGMEKAVIPSIVMDTTNRRRRLLEMVRQWQATPLRDESFRAAMIQRACTALTRPSCLFARHLAHVVAAANDQDVRPLAP